MRNNPLIIALIAAVLALHLSCRNSETPFNGQDIKRAERLFGLSFSNEDIDTILPYLQRNLEGYDSMRQFSLDREVMPAVLFNPVPQNFKYPQGTGQVSLEETIDFEAPQDLDSLCFYPVWKLAHLIRNQKISSTELTQHYLSRIKKYDKTLKAFITITEELALEQAVKADQELAQGLYRGPLHGIPYGLKDLIAVKGYPTTWGATPFQNQQIDYSATVAIRLRKAGAVLLGKLSSGALARGDVWFGGQTVCPWDTLIGASGSSAGSAAATAAGLVGFSLGTETMGSIMMPSARNGVTGLRPSFGTVSRQGVMTLAWSMDKIGPICRDALDCTLVYDVIHGYDPADPASNQTPLIFDQSRQLSDFRIGILTSEIEEDTTSGAENLRKILAFFDSINIPFVDKKLPEEMPFNAFDIILRSESGAFFDELIRSPEIDAMVQQDQRSRANSLRQSRFIPAAEYLQANRFRTVLINEMHQIFDDIDLLISPPAAENQLSISNLCGIPSLSLPTGLDSLGHPTSMTVLADLYQEGILLEFGQALQKETSFHKKIPPDFFK
ncbi:MAG: amidase [Saprospiraceae bacterium]|nr:amidase [Saprospiraceae bacterium]